MKPFQTIAQSIGLAALLAFGAAAQAADVALTPNEMAFKDGRAVLDDNSEFTTKTIRITIEPNKKLEPHGPKESYFFAEQAFRAARRAASLRWFRAGG